MALIEDVISIVLIVFFLIILGSVLSGYLFTEQLDVVEQTEEEYLQDYYRTSLDSFLNYRENQTNLPHHILIGNYIARGERTAIAENGSEVDVNKKLNKTLNQFYGKNNYYQRIRQDYVNTTLSFVIDGSDSNRIERQIINQTIDDIETSVEETFGDSDAEVITKAYVLGNDDQCESFDGVECELLSSSQLYSGSPSSTEPWFGDSEKITHYVESDWLGGSIEAEKRFRDTFEGTSREVHIVIPVFDQISTSSVPSYCFDQTDTTTYRACRLCYQEPSGCQAANRSRKDLATLNQFFKQREPNSIVMPVFSFDCNFQDVINWKNIWPDFVEDAAVKDSVEHDSSDLASDEGLCHLSNCGACSAPSPGSSQYIESDSSSYNNVCFRSECNQNITRQMMNVTEETNGAYVSIDNRQEIATEVADTIEDVFAQRQIEFGVKQENRTRYVFERRIVLPNAGDTNVRLWVYDVPEGDV